MLRILNITGPDILQGNGVRCTLWVSGCKHHCPMCHNQWTWNYNQGMIYTEKCDEILEKISEYLSKDYYDGLTISGGDPLCQDIEGLLELKELIENVKEKFPTKDIWLYTGYTLNELLPNADDDYGVGKEKKLKVDIINKCEYIVEGRYEHEKRDLTLHFRGSSNQNILKKVGDCNFITVDLENKGTYI